MGKRNDNRITVIDAGSSTICVLVVECTDAGLQYSGHGIAESRGSRKGAIVDLDKAVASIQAAVEGAEESTGQPIESAIVGIGGPHIRGVNARGGITTGPRPREITRDDVRQALDKARSVSIPADREVLHLLPQEFILDEQIGIREPAGMVGTRLEAKAHVVTALINSVQNVVTAVNRAGVQVDDTVFEALACADCTLKTDERELGVCLADIGAGSTDVVVFCEGSVAYAGVVPIGGDHFTNDVAVGLRTPLVEAEKIKRIFGGAAIHRVSESSEIEVPAVGDRPSRLMPQRTLAQILEPRARELFEMLADTLAKAGVLELCATGVVLTGGGGRLVGLAELAETVLQRPARIGYPAPIQKLPSALAQPEFATAIGMAVYARRARLSRAPQDNGFTAKMRSLFAKSGS